jgi:hypothetical protein
MEKESFIKVFIGSEASVILLKSRLEEIGVDSFFKNDSYDANLGTAPQLIDLYINKGDLKKAEPLIKELSQNR